MKNENDMEVGFHCIICDEMVWLNARDQERLRYRHLGLFICDSCKEAIAWAKEHMKKEDDGR